MMSRTQRAEPGPKTRTSRQVQERSYAYAIRNQRRLLADAEGKMRFAEGESAVACVQAWFAESLCPFLSASPLRPPPLPASATSSAEISHCTQ